MLFMNITDFHEELQAVTEAAALYGVRVVTTNCTSHGSSYNKGLAISSIFIILVVSLAGFLTPVFFSTRKHKVFGIVVAVFNFIGTAILLTVGFIHILGDAAADLASPCLPQGFTKSYPSWGLLICVITIMLMMLGDHFAQGYIESTTAAAVAEAQACMDFKTNETTPQPATGSTDATPCSVTCSEAGKHLCSKVDESLDLEGDCCHLSAGELVALRRKRAMVFIVEFSVCTHSIPVGLDLGLQSAASFVGLFVAIIFHQLLEGLGVGAAVADAQMPLTTVIWMSLGFALTCPLGIAIGVGLRSHLNENGPTYLFLLGIVNAIASGMLIYTALVHMNAFASRGRWLRQQGWLVQLLCFAAFCAAGASMLVVGKWA